jgi:addiction module HigA family antidote
MGSEFIKNPNAGDILKEEFLMPLKISQNALAKAINVPNNRIHSIVKGTRSITADTDLRLSIFFGLSEGYWLRLQNAYDLMEVKRNSCSNVNNIQPYVYENTEKSILV